MNFQELLKIESSQRYFDNAVKAAKQKSLAARTKVSRSTLIKRAIYIETQHIHAMNQQFQKVFKEIVRSYPVLIELSMFYRSLAKLRIDIAQYSSALWKINWSADKIYQLAGMTIRKIHRSSALGDIHAARKAFYGRVNSILERLDPFFSFLEDTRKTLKGLPDIKEGMFTVCICGFPNVGKSTLLKKLTGANPEIASYAFTTKTLNTGTIKTPTTTLQLVDTPGTLNRGKMNKVEQEADLAIRYCSDTLIYVFDLTETYPIGQQYDLLDYLETIEKPIIIYLSKTDLLTSSVVREFQKNFKKPHEVHTQSSLNALLASIEKSASAEKSA